MIGGQAKITIPDVVLVGIDPLLEDLEVVLLELVDLVPAREGLPHLLEVPAHLVDPVHKLAVDGPLQLVGPVLEALYPGHVAHLVVVGLGVGGLLVLLQQLDQLDVCGLQLEAVVAEHLLVLLQDARLVFEVVKVPARKEVNVSTYFLDT